jgi:flagellar export protein FliJ
MAVSRAMLRLLHIRELEEEQSRAALEQAVAERNRLEQALRSAGEHEREGRRLVVRSTMTGQVWERFAGLAESRTAEKNSRLLAAQIELAAEEVAALRAELIRKRVERRQAETLVEGARAHQAVENARREQQSLDDWYLNRKADEPTVTGPAEAVPQPESK